MPIEIGWAFADPETGEILVESHLIRPAMEWHIESCWDKAAERLHGINCGQLYTEGSAPADILRRMNEALGGRELYSAAPAWDGEWLQMIVDAADVNPNFSASRREAHTLIGVVVREQAWKAEDCLAMMEEISRDVPRTHRAAADARHLAALWLAMKKGPDAGE